MRLRKQTIRYLQRPTICTQNDPAAHARSLPDGALVKVLSKSSLDDPSTLFYLLELRRRSAQPGRRRRTAEEFDWTEIVNYLFPGGLRTIQRKLKARGKKITLSLVSLNPTAGPIISPMQVAGATNLERPKRLSANGAAAKGVRRPSAVDLKRFQPTEKNIQIARNSRRRLIGPLAPDSLVEKSQSRLPVDPSKLFSASTQRNTSSLRRKSKGDYWSNADGGADPAPDPAELITD